MTPSPLPARPPFRLPHFAFRISHFAFATILALGLAPLAEATSVTLQGGFGYPKPTAPDGSPLPEGHKVSLGTFPAGFDPATADLPTLLANWKQFSFTTTATLLNDPGSFWLEARLSDGTMSDPASPGGVFSFPGKQIYVLLTRTSAPFSEPAADGSNVRDYAIFTSTSPSWIFPEPPSDTNFPPGDLTEINTSQISTAIAGTADPLTGIFALTTYTTTDPSDGSAPTSAFDQWLAATFGENSGHTADSIVGPSGLSALATFALNSDPAAAAPPYTTATDEATGRIGIQFTRKKSSVSGFQTYAQACSDLSSWALPVTQEVISSTDTTETVRAYPNFPAGSDQSKAFFRIRVEPAN